ncbi:MAG: hypothetical protein K9H14_05495 [Actinomycetia bacterium]|nr:hypothetical protein [Actinomycetes bacterium]
MSKEKGNVTILVLVMAIVILLGTASMIGFVFRDINFTKIDEENLKALSFAEAGIADFQYRLKMQMDNNQELPATGYSQQLVENEVVEGSYSVSYQPINDGDEVIGYDVTSIGIDSSQRQRTIRASLYFRGTLPFDIYDYIYSDASMNYGDITASNTRIVGPFFTNGNLNLSGGVSFLDGPLYVNGDIILGGNSSIGEASNPIDLYLGGVFEDRNGQEIDPLNTGGLANVHISNFSDVLVELPMLVIDDAYIQGLTDKKEIDGDLSITDNNISVNNVSVDNLGNYLFFDENEILNINGNIVVNGNVNIGIKEKAPNSIYYKGNGKIIVTGDSSIIVYYQLVTANAFPQESLMMLLSMSDIFLDFGKSEGSPDAEVVAISNNNLNIEENVILIGSFIAGHIDIDNNSQIYYVEGIREYLPQDIPQSQIMLEHEIIIANWQEIRNQ